MAFHFQIAIHNVKIWLQIFTKLKCTSNEGKNLSHINCCSPQISSDLSLHQIFWERSKSSLTNYCNPYTNKWIQNSEGTNTMNLRNKISSQSRRDDEKWWDREVDSKKLDHENNDQEELLKKSRFYRRRTHRMRHWMSDTTYFFVSWR
jgi:hypothetical protein